MMKKNNLISQIKADISHCFPDVHYIDITIEHLTPNFFESRILLRTDEREFTSLKKDSNYKTCLNKSSLAIQKQLRRFKRNKIHLSHKEFVFEEVIT